MTFIACHAVRVRFVPRFREGLPRGKQSPEILDRDSALEFTTERSLDPQGKAKVFVSGSLRAGAGPLRFRHLSIVPRRV